MVYWFCRTKLDQAQCMYAYCWSLLLKSWSAACSVSTDLWLIHVFPEGHEAETNSWRSTDEQVHRCIWSCFCVSPHSPCIHWSCLLANQHIPRAWPAVGHLLYNVFQRLSAQRWFLSICHLKGRVWTVVTTVKQPLHFEIVATVSAYLDWKLLSTCVSHECAMRST